MGFLSHCYLSIAAGVSVLCDARFERRGTDRLLSVQLPAGPDGHQSGMCAYEIAFLLPCDIA